MHAIRETHSNSNRESPETLKEFGASVSKGDNVRFTYNTGRHSENRKTFEGEVARIDREVEKSDADLAVELDLPEKVISRETRPDETDRRLLCWMDKGSIKLQCRNKDEWAQMGSPVNLNPELAHNPE